ncbi:MAG: NADH-quinone oxidoreductase subunit A [Firmicutes bacterium]|nr:NADH-quinone oxidoreductase subunit A [Bacillota bacterium]
MNEGHLQNYVPLLIYLLVAMGLAGALLVLSRWVGPRRPSHAKRQAYECGITPLGDAREPFAVKFYLVAIAFILFDAETMFLFPWAYAFSDLGWFGFGAMGIFILMLAAGDLYLWKKGVFDWNR